MNLKNVLRTYGMLRQLTDDETALLNTLRGLSDPDCELLVETMRPKTEQSTKKRGRKAGSKSPRASSIQSAIQGTAKPATCTFVVNDADGEQCGALQDDPIHDRTYISSHEFQPKGAAKAAGGE